MFDNPRTELRRLEDRLLTAEPQDEDFERFYSEIDDEFDWVDEEEDYGGYQPLFRNFANGYGRNFVEDTGFEDTEVYAMEADRYEPAQPRKKHGRGLAFWACTECLAITAVMVYFIIRLLP